MTLHCKALLCLALAALPGAGAIAEEAGMTTAVGQDASAEGGEGGLRQGWVVPGGTGLFDEVDGRLVQAVLGGSVVTVLAEQPDWLSVRLEDGTEGWLRPLGVRDDAPPARVEPPPPAMVTTHFAKIGAAITYPAKTVTTEAIRRLAAGEIQCAPNRCAAAMADALGWGLGDAHDWTALPTQGFRHRQVAEGAQSGDIVVWPFTFGSRRSQHIGFAVLYEGAVTLLSNLVGHVQLSAMAPGYEAYCPPPV